MDLLGALWKPSYDKKSTQRWRTSKRKPLEAPFQRQQLTPMSQNVIKSARLVIFDVPKGGQKFGRLPTFYNVGETGGYHPPVHRTRSKIVYDPSVKRQGPAKKRTHHLRCIVRSSKPPPAEAKLYFTPLSAQAVESSQTIRTTPIVAHEHQQPQKNCANAPSIMRPGHERNTSMENAAVVIATTSCGKRYVCPAHA